MDIIRKEPRLFSSPDRLKQLNDIIICPNAPNRKRKIGEEEEVIPCDLGEMVVIDTDPISYEYVEKKDSILASYKDKTEIVEKDKDTRHYGKITVTNPDGNMQYPPLLLSGTQFLLLHVRDENKGLSMVLLDNILDAKMFVSIKKRIKEGKPISLVSSLGKALLSRMNKQRSFQRVASKGACLYQISSVVLLAGAEPSQLLVSSDKHQIYQDTTMSTQIPTQPIEYEDHIKTYQFLSVLSHPITTFPPGSRICNGDGSVNAEEKELMTLVYIQAEDGDDKDKSYLFNNVPEDHPLITCEDKVYAMKTIKKEDVVPYELITGCTTFKKGFKLYQFTI